jgi:hypothetical protein
MSSIEISDTTASKCGIRGCGGTVKVIYEVSPAIDLPRMIVPLLTS